MHKFIARALLLIALDLSVAASQGSGSAAIPAAAQSNTVRIANFAYSPPAVTVAVGQTVTWTNGDGAAHTVTSDTGAWNSGLIQQGGTFSQTFTTAGTFAYHCAVHPNMHGSITVMAVPANDVAPTSVIASAPSAAPSPNVTAAPSVTTAAAGTPVEYSAGWTLVAGPSGTIFTGTSGPLYTYRSGDSSYETLNAATPLVTGAGYWADFDAPVTETLPASSAPPAPQQLPANQWVLIGNSSNTRVVVQGADMVLTYDPIRGYAPATVLQPGQGARAFSATGGTLTMVAAGSTGVTSVRE